MCEDPIFLIRTQHGVGTPRINLIDTENESEINIQNNLKEKILTKINVSINSIDLNNNVNKNLRKDQQLYGRSSLRKAENPPPRRHFSTFDRILKSAKHCTLDGVKIHR